LQAQHLAQPNKQCPNCEKKAVMDRALSPKKGTDAWASTPHVAVFSGVQNRNRRGVIVCAPLFESLPIRSRHFFYMTRTMRRSNRQERTQQLAQETSDHSLRRYSSSSVSLSDMIHLTGTLRSSQIPCMKNGLSDSTLHLPSKLAKPCVSSLSGVERSDTVLVGIVVMVVVIVVVVSIVVVVLSLLDGEPRSHALISQTHVNAFQAQE
jgi:hypothetical protein